MRHRRNTTKLKRNTAHRKSLLANLACSLIEHGRIKTTFGKAKALRPVAEKLVTQAKRNDLHSRRLAIAFLRQKDCVSKLFAEVAPAAANRQGGYCRITKLGQRMTDAAPMALIEWVDLPAAESDELAEAAEETPEPKAEKPAKKAAKKKAEKKAEKKEEEPVAAEAE
jgi:large subunit ribosomal protein L17